MASTSGAANLKRKVEDVLVDPDTQQPIEDAKKPRIDLDSNRKYLCLKSIVEMYGRVLDLAFGVKKKSEAMDTDADIAAAKTFLEATKSVTVGNHALLPKNYVPQRTVRWPSIHNSY